LGHVVSQAELISHRGGWKRNGQVVVCASGSFDLLHPGHIRFLEHARSLGDILVVAVESDTRVRQASKSPSKIVRPVTPATERAEILAALACVDCATEVDGSLEQFLEILAPDIVVQGGTQDSAGSTLPPEIRATPPGWKVTRIPLEPGFSTADLIERITKARA
jgi:rfaE bifunctional protein nucleotidyltransferase chain/domain